MKKNLFLMFALTFSLSSFAVIEKACHPGQDHTVRIWKYRAAVEADKLMQNVRDNLARNDLTFNQWRKISVAGNILHCARRKLGTLKFVCADDTGDKAAKTYPVISNKVYLSDYVFTETQPKYQEGLLLHEATHHCGTNDAAYFDGSKPDNVGIIGWQAIADTYTYWVQHGFCIPPYCR